jgi:hypothetical protein
MRNALLEAGGTGNSLGRDKPDGYLLGSYRIATAPEPNSSRLTSFKSTRFDSPALAQIPAHELRVPASAVSRWSSDSQPVTACDDDATAAANR